MRPKVIAGNWKMNKDLSEGVALINALKERVSSIPPQVRVIVCPPFPLLVVADSLLKGTPIALGAQNMSEHDDGAYTGEVSWRMLKSAGCEYVILGHSERRQYFKETNEIVNMKAKKALANNLKPIICVGETLEEREQGITEQVISVQVRSVLDGLSSSEINHVIIAYEPVWAIGTGKNATPVQAEMVHKHIRKLIGQSYSWAVAERVIIQYGGSVKPENAAELLGQENIDGALVGGACLMAGSFLGIIAPGKG